MPKKKKKNLIFQKKKKENNLTFNKIREGGPPSQRRERHLLLLRHRARLPRRRRRDPIRRPGNERQPIGRGPPNHDRVDRLPQPPHGGGSGFGFRLLLRPEIQLHQLRLLRPLRLAAAVDEPRGEVRRSGRRRGVVD